MHSPNYLNQGYKFFIILIVYLELLRLSQFSIQFSTLEKRKPGPNKHRVEKRSGWEEWAAGEERELDFDATKCTTPTKENETKGFGSMFSQSATQAEKNANRPGWGKRESIGPDRTGQCPKPPNRG